MEPMDRPRASQTGKRTIRLLLYVVLTLSLVIGITVSLSHLDPAPPRVDRANVWIDTVRKDPLVIQVRGSGKLVPEKARWIPARTQGRVQQLVVPPVQQCVPEVSLSCSAIQSYSVSCWMRNCS